MKISELTALTVPDALDLLYIVDVSAGTSGSKKITVAEFLAGANLGSHDHAAADITSGVLILERGGLGFNASAVAIGNMIVGIGAGTMGLLTGGSDGQVPTKQPDGSIAFEDAVGGALDSIEFKGSVKAATTANITLSGAQTIDGVSCVAGDRVLPKHQTIGSENGIYVVSTGAWLRASDMPVGSDAAATFGHIQQGTVNGGSKWLCTNNTGSATVGTDALVISTMAVSGDVRIPTGNDLFFAGATGGEIHSGGSSKMLFGALGVAMSTGITFCFSDLSDDTGTTINWGAGNIRHMVLDADKTLTFTPPKAQTGGEGSVTAIIVLLLEQDGTGNRSVTWPAEVAWPGGSAPVLTSSASKTDLIYFVWDGITYLGFIHKDYAA